MKSIPYIMVFFNPTTSLVVFFTIWAGVKLRIVRMKIKKIYA